MTTVEKNPDSNRRRWLATLLATPIMLFSYGMILFAFAAGPEDEPIFAGGVLGIGLGLVPAAFVTAGFVSQNERALRSALISIVIWFCVVIPVGIVDLPTGLVAGFGAGGIVSFRRREQHSWQVRATAVAALALYTFLLLRVSPRVGLFAGAPLSFPAIMAADSFCERRIQRSL